MSYAVERLFVPAGGTGKIILTGDEFNESEIRWVCIPENLGALSASAGELSAWKGLGTLTIQTDTSASPKKITLTFNGATSEQSYTVFISNTTKILAAPEFSIANYPAKQVLECLKLLVYRVNELSVESMRSLKIPEFDGDTMAQFVATKEQRANKVMAFDADGNAIVGFNDLFEIVDLTRKLEDAVFRSETAAKKAKTSETNSKNSETNSKKSETNAANSETNAKTSETIAKNCETEILLKEVRIDEKAAEYLIRLEKYKYVVLSREEYDNLQTKQPDTIYFVKGNVDYSELVEELSKSQQDITNYTVAIANRLDQEITARQQTMERVNELEADLSTALVDVNALENRVNVRADALETLINETNGTYTRFAESVAQALVLLDTTATLTQQGVVKLSTSNTIQNGSPVGVNADGQLSVPVASANYAGAVRICTDTVQTINQCGWTGKSSNGELLILKPALTGTAMRFGAVRIADNLDDTNAHACMTASQIKSTLNGWAQFFATDNSPSPNDMGIHGKALFASQNNNDGGLYIGGVAGGNISWTQWTTRYQRDKIRVYGKNDGVYEDFYLEPSDDPENQKLQIARLKDIPTIDTTTLVDLTSDQQITGTKTIMGKWFRFAFDEVDLEQGGAVEISGSRGGMYFKTVGSQYFATINLFGLTKNEIIAFKSDIPDITGKADQTALDALIARVAALETASQNSL